MLSQKNGFYAFERALHVFPAGCQVAGLNLEDWNDNGAWRQEYGDLLDGILFFAEDAFGNQFGLVSSGICRFDPESGELEPMADTLDEWASLLLADCDFHTGTSLAQEWQAQNEALPDGKRLLPKTPFLLGGVYGIDNLYASDALQGMRFRAEMWRQIRELPDGTPIELKIIG